MKPILRPIAWVRNGLEFGTGRPYEYHASLSPTEEVFIANFGGRPHRDDWQFLRIKDGVSGHWTGSYASAEEALTLGK
jgi:hypothetical protein